jgi:hypothetical protein
MYTLKCETDRGLLTWVGSGQAQTLAYFFATSVMKKKKVFQIFHQIPAFLRECRDHSAAPMDGQTLSDTLHNRGINIRYLGIVANLVLDFFSGRTS